MGAPATKLTAKQYFEVTVEGDRTQLVDGALVVNEPKPIHNALQARFVFELTAWVRQSEGRGLALTPTDVVMDEHNVFGPDVLWIAEQHRPTDLSSRLLRVPDICVEIRSTSTWRYDIGAKKSAYERGGLPELWLIDDVAETVLVFRRETPKSPRFDMALELTRADTLTSPQLPGFELSLDSLFDL